MNEFDYLAKASIKLDNEQYDDAIDLCNKALKIDKSLSDAYNIRGNANYYLRKLDKANCDYTKAIEIMPNKPKYYYNRSCLNLELGNTEEAIVDVIKAIELEPDNSLYYYEKARIEQYLKRYNEAAVTFSKGIDIFPTENLYIGRALCYIELEKYDLAFDDLNSALEIYPESGTAYYYKGVIKRILGNYLEATDDLEKAFELNPLDDGALIEIGKCKAEMGKLDGALKYINKAIKLNPSESNHKIRVLAREKALKMRQNIINLYNNKPISDIKEHSVEIFNEKQARDDIKDFNIILNFSPDNIDILVDRLKRYFYLKDYSNSLKDIKTVEKMEFVPRELVVEVLSIKSIAEFKLAQYEKSVEDLSASLAFDKNAKFYYYRALANFNLKNYILAYFDIKKAFELNNKAEFNFEDKMPKAMELILNFFKEKPKKSSNKENNIIGLSGLKKK